MYLTQLEKLLEPLPGGLGTTMLPVIGMRHPKKFLHGPLQHSILEKDDMMALLATLRSHVDS